MYACMETLNILILQGVPYYLTKCIFIPVFLHNTHVFTHTNILLLPTYTYSFKFTKLIKDDPTREFNFTLKRDDSNDNYMLTNVNPTLDRTQTDILLTMLNADGKSGFHSFVVGMSK